MSWHQIIACINSTFKGKDKKPLNEIISEEMEIKGDELGTN
jgi:hypothetical protein